MRKKYNFVLMTMLLCPLLIMANGRTEVGGSIAGTVKTSDGQQAAGVAILVKETSRTVVTNESGEFLLRNLPAGAYHLVVAMKAYDKNETSVTVADGETAKVTIELSYTSQKLEEVVITSGGNRFAKKESEDVSKLPLRNMENPQVYTVVSKELMKEQVVTDYNSVFKNVPGAGIAEIRNQGRTTNISRGFATPQLVRNGVGSFTYTTVDPANLERIEVIKGPSATLFGSTLSSFGGLFNRYQKAI